MSKKRMLILVNQDLKISKEKLGVQIGHAVSTFMYYHYIREMAIGKDIKKELEELKVYMEEDNQGKILLACPERKLEELEKEGYLVIRDAGLTELKQNTLTCVMLGIYNQEDRPMWTNTLKLYKEKKPNR